MPNLYAVTGKSAGDQVSSSYEGRHITFPESYLTFKDPGDGLVDKGLPVLVGDNIVGVAFKSAKAATDLIAIDTEGIWFLNVVASDGIGTNAVSIGDTIYISSTGILSKDPSGTPFGESMVDMNASASAAVGCVKVHNKLGADGEIQKGTRFTVHMPSFEAADVAKGIWIAPAPCKVIEALEAHGTVAGQAGVLNVEKCNSGEAAASGNNVLATGWDLTTTINVPVTLAAVTDGEEELVDGDELRLRLTSGSAASLADAVVAIVLEWT